MNRRSQEVALRDCRLLGVATLVGLTVLGSPAVAEVGDPNRPARDDDRARGFLEERQVPMVSASVDCDAFYDALVDADADELVELIRTTDISCIRELAWGPSGDVQAAAVGERNVLAAAKGVEDALEGYAGAYGTGVRRLFVFLRIVEDIRYWCLFRRQEGGTCGDEVWNDRQPWSVGPGSDVYETLAEALDAFYAHDRFGDTGSEHANVLAEYVRTIDSYEQNARHLHVVVYWLNRWGERYSGEDFQDFAGHMMHILFGGHRMADFPDAFGEDRELADALHDCAMKREWLGTESRWIAQRCGAEIGRFTKYRETSNYVYVRTLISSLRSEYEGDDEGRGIWLRVVVEVDYYDADNCDLYGMCHWYEGDGFAANFRAAVFVERLECPTNHCPADRITVHAQALGDDKLGLACQRLDAYGEVFHDLFDTGCEPVADDFNDHLDIYVFHDISSCEGFSDPAFFDDVGACSGIYYETDPADPDKTPFLIGTEYEAWENPRDPDLAIWNFEHEYAHYLDSRYNRQGGYREGPDGVHWWKEGFAEYFAAEVSPYIDLPSYYSPYTLSEIVLRSHSLGTRYRYRHLAVRYFMENDRGFLDTILGHMRRGEYRAFQGFLRTRVAAHEDAWRTWLQSGAESVNPVDSDGPDHVVAFFPSASDALGRQGFARVVNHSDEERTVGIVAVDDEGRRSEPLTLVVGARETVHFNSEDLEDGNPEKGLTGGAGTGQGDWRVELTGALDVDVLSYIRTEDGLLASMHDTVPRDGDIHRVPIFNPGSNPNQESLLRIVNLGDEEASVEITGTDDGGEPGGPVTVRIPAGEARTYSAAELEVGGGDMEGSLGDGTGKWRLEVESAERLVVMSLMSTRTGHMTNLSTLPPLLE